jgi:hypothetical protein
MPSSSCHVKLALYLDDMVVIAMSPQPALLVKYLETYLSDLEWWLREWRITINVLKSYAILLTNASWCIPNPDQFSSLGSQSTGLIMPVILG